MFANPAATGYTPYPPSPARPAAKPPAKKNTAQVVLIAAIIVLFGVAAVRATARPSPAACAAGARPAGRAPGVPAAVSRPGSPPDPLWRP